MRNTMVEIVKLGIKKKLLLGLLAELLDGRLIHSDLNDVTRWSMRSMRSMRLTLLLRQDS